MADQTSSLGEPRIPPLEPEELSAELLDLVQRMITVSTALQARDRSVLTDVIGLTDPEKMREALKTVPEITRTMLRHPQLFARQTDFGIELVVQGALPARDRELAVLRIGWLCQAPFEWGEHVGIAKKIGFTREDFERIIVGSTAPDWSEHERAVVRAAEECHANARFSDATWATLAKTYDDRQLIELPIVIGHYTAVAYYQNTLRVRMHPGNLGLDAR